jgi:NAD(P) transhydrogenase
VESVEELSDGGVVANLESKKKVSGDALLFAVGRQGNVDELNLAGAGLEADNRGRIPVDENFMTKVEHIFAVGDVVGFPALASVSMEQGRIAAARAFNDHATSSNPGFYPYGIYTIPEISFIGKTEEQLTDEDVPYEVGMAYYREVARTNSRGYDRPPQADLPSRHEEGSWGTHHRRRCKRAGPHWAGGHDVGRHRRLFCRDCFQLPDPRRVLQGRGF